MENRVTVMTSAVQHVLFNANINKKNKEFRLWTLALMQCVVYGIDTELRFAAEFLLLIFIIIKFGIYVHIQRIAGICFCFSESLQRIWDWELSARASVAAGTGHWKCKRDGHATFSLYSTSIASTASWAAASKCHRHFLSDKMHAFFGSYTTNR